MNVWVDRSTQILIRALEPNHPSRVMQSHFYLAPASATDAALTLIPVRGVSTEEAEIALRAAGHLSATDLLRVRALDWSRPVSSRLRCTLFRSGSERVRRLEFTGASVAELIRPVFLQILDQYPLPQGAQVLAVREEGTDPIPMTVTEFAAALSRHIETSIGRGRTHLEDVRRARICESQRHPTAPLVPGLECR
jgi:hypothetical protein